ncbi:hypothetical protein T484DRAFT_3440521 [Baffinella frigidus]|nr:hypothetical protein T484DRAFT_3440521 [Cryptophyta sp. CCMP2293]
MVNFSQRPERELQREQAKQKALGFTDEEIERQSTFPYKRVGCCNDHSSAVMHLDFDVEGKYLRSTSQSNELLYCMLPHGKQSMATQELSTRKFASETCVLGWTVKSIWGRGSMSGSINSLDRTKSKVPRHRQSCLINTKSTESACVGLRPPHQTLEKLEPLESPSRGGVGPRLARRTLSTEPRTLYPKPQTLKP